MKIFKKLRHKYHLNRFGHYYALSQALFEVSNDTRMSIVSRALRLKLALRFDKRAYYHFEEYMCQDVGKDLEQKMRKIFRENEVEGF